MPAFHSASISTKMLQELGGATVIGPLLVGLDRPVQIVPLGAKDTQLVNMAALAAYQCERLSERRMMGDLTINVEQDRTFRRHRRGRHAGHRGWQARLRARGQARALSARQWLRRPQRARHHRRGDLVLARGAHGGDERLQGGRLAAGPADGRHRCRRGRRTRSRSRATPRNSALPARWCCRRSTTRACPTTDWLPISTRSCRRRPPSRCRSISIISRPCPDCPGTWR